MPRLHFLRMEGKETFKHAVQAMVSAATEVLRRCEIDIAQDQVHHPAPGEPPDH
jgi:3-oxoacyl-[acyl-carrier-protein] synthase III